MVFFEVAFYPTFIHLFPYFNIVFLQVFNVKEVFDVNNCFAFCDNDYSGVSGSIQNFLYFFT